MNKYEVLYIIAPTLDEAKREALIERLSALVASNGGQVENVNKWGNRRLAYPINFKNEGFYVLMSYEAKSEFNLELERQMRIAKDEIMRFMITSRE